MNKAGSMLGMTPLYRVQATDKGLTDNLDVPKAPVRPTAPRLEPVGSNNGRRNEAIVKVYVTDRYSCQQIADYYGLYFTTVGLIARKARTGQTI